MIIHRYPDGSEGFEYEPGDRVIVGRPLKRTIQGGWFDYGPTRAERCIVKRRHSRSNRPTSWHIDTLDIHYSDEWGYAECSPWGVEPHPETYEKASVVQVTLVN